MTFISDMPEAQAEDLKDGFFIPGVDANKENVADQNVKIPFVTLQEKMGGGSSSTGKLVSPRSNPLFNMDIYAISNNNPRFSLAQSVFITFNYNPNGFPMPVIKGMNFYCVDSLNDESSTVITRVQYQIWTAGYSSKLIDDIYTIPFPAGDNLPSFCQVVFDSPLNINDYTENHQWNPGQPIIVIIGNPDYPADVVPGNTGYVEGSPVNANFQLIQTLTNPFPGLTSSGLVLGDNGLMDEMRFTRTSSNSFDKRIQDIDQSTAQQAPYLQGCTPWIQFVIEG